MVANVEKMNLRTIDKIILKFIEDRISDEEIVVLKQWLGEDKNKIYFDEFVEMNCILNSKINFNSEKSLNEVAKFIELNKKKKFNHILKYAAIFVMILGGTYYFNNSLNIESEIINTPIESMEITLELNSGEVLELQNSKHQQINNTKGELLIVQSGDELNYQQEKSKEGEELVYNKLNVPYGKTFQLVLSDGTRVHVNAGTTLKYPVKFIEDQDRLVYVDGEAYFDVVSDEKHPFIVHTKAVNIRVLGTKFNVSNYTEDAHINTVLVEGLVHVYDENKDYDRRTAFEIIPGQLASWNKDKNKIEVSNVDTSLYTGWIKGVFVFKHMKFSDIIIKLERAYNVTIINGNKELNSETFTARFENATIEHILETLKKNYGIQYNINDNLITIN